MTRTCPTCGSALAADANPRRIYCSQPCRFQNPERRAADAERHRRRYAGDPQHRATANARRTENYRKARTNPKETR